VVPLFARGFAQATLIPLGVIAMLVMFALIMRLARSDIGTAGVPAPAR
jgi:hypothetical protein